MLLYFQSEKIFNNINDYDKTKAKSYLKMSLFEFLINSNNINTNKIDEKVESDLTKVTLETLMTEAIATKELIHKNKFKIMKEDGIDTSVKQKRSSTVAQYKAISNYLFKFFDKNLDIKDLKKIQANNFRKYLMSVEKEKIDKVTKEIEIENINNNTINLYIRQLQTIFKDYINDNELDRHNPFSNFKELPVSKNKKMYSFYDFEKAKDIFNAEDYEVFQILLSSGMRFEELCTIKKENIKNNSFYFKDAKKGFDKVVPIHISFLNSIDKKLEILNDDDYLFFTDIIRNRVSYKRPDFNQVLKENFDKTLHKTRTTFITYLNVFNEGFSDKDIKSLTHKLQGTDDKNYVITRNLNNLKNIINSIDFKKLEEIEELVA